MGPGCPEACQRQIDDLNSSQAQQDELLNAHGRTLQNHEGRITDLEKAFDD
jgi:peptidoglycan hydrolase CwlO-like protein